MVIKKILVLLGGLILLAIIVVAIVSFMTPTDFKVQREIVIDKQRAAVFSYAKFLRNQNVWGPWIKKDPNIVLNYRGTDGEVGSVVSWSSQVENVGVGEQEITKLVEPSEINSELRFKKPMEATNQAFMKLDEVSLGQTKVTWGFSGSMARPMNVFLVFMDLDKMVGKDFEEGLTNLKEILEKQ